MSARKSFIKNSLMAIAVSLLPKVLRPMDGEVEEDIWLNGDPVGAYCHPSIMELARGNVIVYDPDKYTKLWWD